MTDTRWTADGKMRWKRNRSPQQLARDKGETKNLRRRRRARRLALIASRVRTVRTEPRPLARTISMSESNHLAFMSGISKRQARLELQAQLRRRLGYGE